MKSLQICLLSAMLVIAASNPIPADEPVSLTNTPVISSDAAAVTPGLKTDLTDLPAVPTALTTDLPATQKSTYVPMENENMPDPLALPSKKEEPAPVKAEEKKLVVGAVEQPTLAPVVETQPEQVTGKLLPEQSVKYVAVVEGSTPKVEQLKSAESAIKSVNVEKPAQVKTAVPTVTATVDAAPEAKQAVESTVVPIVPSAIGTEKKIDAEAPLPIVSENKKSVEPAELEQKSLPALPALPVPAGQMQTVSQQQEVAQPQERSASELALPFAAAAEQNPLPSSESLNSTSSEKNVEEKDSSLSSSSEESKESQEKSE